MINPNVYPLPSQMIFVPIVAMLEIALVIFLAVFWKNKTNASIKTFFICLLFRYATFENF